jgi:16S rRNA C1402 N4-methylase RsmH
LFQVNDEFGELKKCLDASVPLLSVGGCIVTLTFHSIEHRMARDWFDEQSGVMQQRKRSREAAITKQYDPMFDDTASLLLRQQQQQAAAPSSNKFPLTSREKFW